MAEITKNRQTVANFFRLIRNGARVDAKFSGTTSLESNDDKCSSIFGWRVKCTYESKIIKVNKIIVLEAKTNLLI